MQASSIVFYANINGPNCKVLLLILLFSFPVMSQAIIMTRGARHLNTLLLGQNWVTMCLLTAWHLRVHSPCHHCINVSCTRSTRAWRVWATAARWWPGWWAATTTSSSRGASSTSAPPSRSAGCRLLQTLRPIPFLLFLFLLLHLKLNSILHNISTLCVLHSKDRKHFLKSINPVPTTWLEAALPVDHVKIVSHA